MVLCQPSILWNDPAGNRTQLAHIFKQYSGIANVFVLPEMFTTGFLTDPEEVDLAQQPATILWMKECAATHNAAIAGSVIVYENKLFYNRFYWVNPDGEFHHYDKRHLFSLGHEDRSYTKGEKRVVISYKGWKIMPLICYDLRFPVWARNTYRNNEFEYDIMMVSANWPASRSFHWRQLLMARAIENQSFSIGVNRKGSDGNGLLYNGGSCMASPEGMWLPMEHDSESDAILVNLEPGQLNSYRKAFPFARDWDNFTIE